MVRENRIKNYKFSETINAATTGSFVSEYPINGEILEVESDFNRAGSLSFSFADSGEVFLAENALSGTNFNLWRPRAITNDNAGDVTVGSVWDYYVTNDHLVLGVTGVGSGTTPLNINVRYR